MPSRRSKKGSKGSDNTRHKNAKEHDEKHRKKNPEHSKAIISVQSETDESVAMNFYMFLEEWFEERKTQVRYICGQLERAPTTGTLHFQAYVQLKRSQRQSWWKKNIHPTANLTFQNKNDITNEYCRHYGIKPVDNCNCKVCGDIDQDTISEEEEWMQEDYDWIEGEYSSSDASFSVEVEII